MDNSCGELETEPGLENQGRVNLRFTGEGPARDLNPGAANWRHYSSEWDEVERWSSEPVRGELSEDRCPPSSPIAQLQLNISQRPQADILSYYLHLMPIHQSMKLTIVPIRVAFH